MTTLIHDIISLQQKKLLIQLQNTNLWNINTFPSIEERGGGGWEEQLTTNNSICKFWRSKCQKCKEQKLKKQPHIWKSVKAKLLFPTVMHFLEPFSLLLSFELLFFKNLVQKSCEALIRDLKEPNMSHCVKA